MARCLLILAGLILLVSLVLVAPLQAQTATSEAQSPATIQASLSQWSVSIRAATANEGANPRLAFGMRNGATDGFDAQSDGVHPPAGPGATSDAYFLISHPLFPQLDKDYRALAGNTIWHLEVKSTAGVTLSWNSSEAPASTTIQLTGAGLSLDMKAASSVNISGGTHHILITASAQPGSAGDANEDGLVNMGDVTKVELIILGLADGTTGADANGDGQVNMGDVTKIELIILGLA